MANADNENWVTVEIKEKNTNFKNRFKQSALISLSNKNLQEEITLIREHCGIPEQGFVNFDDFENWLIEENNRNFLKISKIFKNLKYISAEPESFLQNVVRSLMTDGDYPTDLYFLFDAESFNAIVHEKPFPGIVHYVLWNQILIPETNGLQLTFDEFRNPVLRFGSKATMDDVREMFPVLNKLFQTLKSKEKGSARIKRTYDRNKKILLIKSKKNYNTSYDAVDIIMGPGYEMNKKEDQKKLTLVRQIRKQNKKD